MHALFVLSLISSGALQPEVHDSDSSQANNVSLGNMAELHDALRKIKRFIEADALKAGTNMTPLLKYFVFIANEVVLPYWHVVIE